MIAYSFDQGGLILEQTHKHGGNALWNLATQPTQDTRLRSNKLKYAWVWGSGKYDGIMVKRSHILQDGDIIKLHI